MDYRKQQRTIIKEDGPAMRSVAIQSRSGMPAPIPFGRTTVAPQQKVAPKSSSSSGQGGAAWRVGDLPSLPSFYRLERTHVKIDDVSAMEVASRIADCLRAESVSSTYFNDEAMVEAETQDCVHFTTRLFTHQGKVIVEMQRQCGCCISFHVSAKAVLRAAKGMEAQAKREYPIPANLPKCPEEEEREILEHDVEVVSGLLKKDRLDAQALAMVSLSQLSKSDKCECLVAKQILCGPLLSTIVSLIESWCVFKDARDEEEKAAEVEEKLCAEMHRLAITVLANCLDALEKSGEIEAVLKDRQGQVMSSNLLLALVDELRRADERPHDACEAARCLQPLVRCCPDCRPRLLEFDAVKAAASAMDTGICSHAKLEKESRLLTQEIANCN